MKCLLCSSKFKEQKDLLNHYVTCHNVDKNNWFFQNIFQIKNKSVLQRCSRCDKFVVNDEQKAVHNFFQHYDDGKTMPFEEKTIDILKLPALTIYIQLSLENIKIFMIFTILSCMLIIF